MINNGIFSNEIFFEEDTRKTCVRVTDDAMQAWLYLAPKIDHSIYTKQELIDILSESGVVFGLNESNLSAMAKKCVYNREIKVADAKLPVDGKDGFFEYAFDTSLNRLAPKIREDGSVDYQSMNIVQNVKKGTLLARYHHAVHGENGMDVLGRVIPVKGVRDLPALIGIGVERDETDINVYRSSQDGKIEFTDGKLSIISIYEIKGDVDQITGRVEFYGDVHISGSVEAGVVVKAGKTLTIDGTVESSDLFAGGDIILKRGIQGNQKAKIMARGSIYADFIEHATAQAGGNIEANVIMSSNIQAGGKVILTGKKGSLIGGITYATHGVKCNYLGNDVEITTRVIVGCTPKIFDECKRIDVEIMKLKDLEEEEEGEVADKLKELKEKQTQILMQIDMIKGATIRVDEVIYKGCDLEIDMCRMKIDKNNRSMEYRNIAGMIAGTLVAL